MPQRADASRAIGPHLKLRLRACSHIGVSPSGTANSHEVAVFCVETDPKTTLVLLGDELQHLRSIVLADLAIFDVPLDGGFPWAESDALLRRSDRFWRS